ncbi:hypothetical protein F5887DRAFT_1189110 [Amanita rubescens]|nr:hypothetical protein F5887DRAFT_1189110 [Amanita rubescens]
MSDPHPEADFRPVFWALEQCGMTPVSHLVMALLTEARFKQNLHTVGLLNHAGNIVYALLKHRKVSVEAQKRAGEALHSAYAAEIEALVDVDSNWHFSALRAIPKDVEDFKLGELSVDIDSKAPMLSGLLEVLLSARNRRKRCGSESEAAQAHPHANPDDDEVLLEGQVRTPSSPEEQRETKQKEKEKMLTIKKAVIMSILMQSTNQKANNLQSLVGSFLHSCCTPERVVNALASSANGDLNLNDICSYSDQVLVK